MKEDEYGLDFQIPEASRIDPNVSGLPSRYFCIALGAQHVGKTLPTSLLEEVIAGTDASFALLGGPEDVEKGRALAAQFGARAINFAGECTIHQSASLVAQSAGIVTGDTGLMHIASALNVPVVSVWGCTSPALGMSAYRPHESSAVVEPLGRSKRPCSKLGDRCKYGKGNRCIEAIEAEQVTDLLRRLQ